MSQQHGRIQSDFSYVEMNWFQFDLIIKTNPGMRLVSFNFMSTPFARTGPSVVSRKVRLIGLLSRNSFVFCVRCFYRCPRAVCSTQYARLSRRLAEQIQLALCARTGIFVDDDVVRSTSFMTNDRMRLAFPFYRPTARVMY